MTLQLCKTLLSRASFYANLCLQNPNKEATFWKTACDHVLKAHTVFVDRLAANDPAFTPQNFNQWEREMLETKTPVVVPIVFFGDDNNGSNNTTQTHHPPPPAWRTVETLQARIKELEDEKHRNETNLQHNHKEDLTRMQMEHDEYRQRAERQQSQLSQELKKMCKLVEHKDDEIEEVAFVRRSLDTVKQRFDEYKAKNHDEMQRLYRELETKTFETNQEQQRVQELQNEVRVALQETQRIRQSIHDLERENQLLKHTLERLAPLMTDQQRDVIVECMAVTED